MDECWEARTFEDHKRLREVEIMHDRQRYYRIGHIEKKK